MNKKELSKTVEVKIPDSDVIINIKSELPWYDELEMVTIKDNIERSKFLIFKIIDSWNLKEEDETPTPITKEITDKFSSNIYIPLYAAINKILKERNEKKKTLPKTWFSFFRVFLPVRQKNGLFMKFVKEQDGHTTN